MKVIDISLPLSPNLPVWPGDPPLELEQVSSISGGEMANVSRITMSVHCGTHIDAPKHFIDSGKTIDQIPFEKMMGEVLVLQMEDEVSVITEQVLKAHPDQDLLRKGSKVLFRTRNSHLWLNPTREFREDFVAIDASGAAYLNTLHLDLIGIDYLSIAPFDQPTTPHVTLLTGEAVLLEGLDLSQVESGVYEIICLPLKIPGCEGAPARVVLIEY